MYMTALHTLNYYENKCLLVFLHTLSTKQEHMPKILHILFKISINNHPLLYIHINAHKYT